MANLGAEAKAGYFATPPEQTELIANKLIFGEDEEGEKVNICDPCAGEGTALKQIAETLKKQGGEVTTFGIELEESRAQKAKEVLGYVIADGYEAIRMTNQALSLMYLNPPYQETRNKEREEVRFLRDLTDKRLQPGGLLIFVIPQYILGKCSGMLANRFEEISVYRFTDDFYPVFKQIVLFGYRKEKSSSGPKARRTRDWLKSIAESGPGVVPALDKEDEATYTVPVTDKEVELFRDGKVSIDEVKEVLGESNVFERMERMITPPEESEVRMKSPVMPLKLAHMGTAIAAGAVGGNMGNHIVTGTTSKVSEVHERTEETVARTEKMVTTVKVFSPEHGVVKLE
ncbi:MAG: DUF6094 domain-containing protein [Clostridiales bacterium]|nr:DUF6094 domain-containing protein [Clostridiales bacterium]MCF8023674.1 DUF6094 domain-containing protein [Clostridiales bacterium]